MTNESRTGLKRLILAKKDFKHLNQQILWFPNKQDKYTLDPAQSNKSKQSENNFQQKVTLKKIIKTHKLCIIYS